MFELSMGIGVGLFLFCACVIAYITGVGHGKEIGKGNAPKIELNPIKPIVKAVERHKEEKKAEELTEELNDIFSFSKESALEAVKKER